MYSFLSFFKKINTDFISVYLEKIENIKLMDNLKRQLFCTMHYVSNGYLKMYNILSLFLKIKLNKYFIIWGGYNIINMYVNIKYSITTITN